MLASQAFFSFTEVPEPADHPAYNAWHQLDHRPENLALPGVVWGERWVHAPDCAEVSAAAGPLARLHYANTYLFAEPAEASRAAWTELAERSFHWGRRADVAICERLLMDHVRVITARTSDRVAVSPEALPFRPSHGIHLTVTRVADPRSVAAERRFGWWDRERLPSLLSRRGCAGAYLYASESTFLAHLDLGGRVPPSLRLVVAFLDTDPVEFTRALLAEEGPLVDDDVEEVLFAGPLRAITPWRWDWFAAGGSVARQPRTPGTDA